MANQAIAPGAAAVNLLLDYMAPFYASVSEARTAFLSLHPDYKNKPIDVHPSNVDNWLTTHENDFNWVLTAYKKLLVENKNLEKIQVTTSDIGLDDVRIWVQNSDTKKLREYPYEVVSALNLELSLLLKTYTNQDLREAAYRAQHPPDTTFIEALKPVTKELAKVAPYIQTVSAFVPGIGTIASVAIGVTTAALQGKSLAEISESAAAGAVPGGPLVVASAKAVVNIGKAAVTGQNILKATGNAAYSAALQYISDPKLRAVADKAIKGIASGQNVLSVAEQAALGAAISQIPDKSAQALVGDAIGGKLNSKSILSAMVSNDSIPSSAFSASLVAATKTLGVAKDLAANARDEIVAASSNFITDPTARQVIAAATSKILAGKDPTASERQKAIDALNSVKEPSAKKVLQTLIEKGSDPKTVFANTDGALVKVLVKSDLNSNVAKLLEADSSTLPEVKRDGPIVTSDVIAGTLKLPSGKTVDGKFMQLVGTGKPTLQFKPAGSNTWLVGFWFQVA